jgi:GDP-L-fucose synthase|tara:strand:- start:754 stop:1659 length:906 start_codon:yes stop_codon:yes gene_type:complete
MTKVLVTGGYGMVGSAMESQIKLSRETCDLTNPKQTEKLFQLIKPDGVIHCAGKVGGIGGNSNYKGEYFYDNLMINTNVIEAARKAGVKNLVAFLSTCVFPDKVKYPLTVDQIQLGEPHSSNYPYAYAKRMADVQIRAYREQYGINYTSIIPSNIYGPNDNFNLDHGHVMPMLIHKLYLAKKNKTDFTVWGSGKPLREFIYSKDIAKIAEWALFNYEGTDPLIISGDEEISIKDLVGLLVDEFKFKGKVLFDKTKPDGQLRKPSDNSKIKELMPDFEYTPFEQGIKETVNWFIENYDEARK